MSRLVPSVLLVAACGSVFSPDDRDEADVDADTDGDTDTDCGAGACPSALECVADGECHRENLQSWCVDGAFENSCGNGDCDCGEVAGEAGCVADCGCPDGGCDQDGDCVAQGSCDEASICVSGSWETSCGNDVCDCGEDPKTCGVECFPELSDCRLPAADTSCDAICGEDGAVCVDACDYLGLEDGGAFVFGEGCGAGSVVDGTCGQDLAAGFAVICCCF